MLIVAVGLASTAQILQMCGSDRGSAESGTCGSARELS